MEKKLVGLSEILDRVELDEDRVQRFKVYDEEKGKETWYHEMDNKELRENDRLV